MSDEPKIVRCLVCGTQEDFFSPVKVDLVTDPDDPEKWMTVPKDEDNAAKRQPFDDVYIDVEGDGVYAGFLCPNVNCKERYNICADSFQDKMIKVFDFERNKDDVITFD